MMEPSLPEEHATPRGSSPTIEDRHLVLIVVGSCLRAEEADRPLAYRLGRRIESWVKRHHQKLSLDMHPVVCTDLWYINHQQLQHRPTICIGGPKVNALSAYFAQHLPEAQRDQPDPRVLIQIDPEFTDLRVCSLGVISTASCVRRRRRSSPAPSDAAAADPAASKASIAPNASSRCCAIAGTLRVPGGRGRVASRLPGWVRSWTLT